MKKFVSIASNTLQSDIIIKLTRYTRNNSTNLFHYAHNACKGNRLLQQNW